MLTFPRGFVRQLLPGLVIASLSASISMAAPQLRLSTTAVGPVLVESGSNAAVQTVNAFNLRDGSLNLSIGSSASWLSASVGALTNCPNGPVSTCLPIQISINSAAMPLGTYTEILRISDPNAIDAPQTITVTLQVNGAPSSAEFYVSPNQGASTTQSSTAAIGVLTGASVLSTVRTQDNGQWLSFSLSGSGSYAFTYPYVLRVSSQVGQAEANYTGTVVLSGSVNPADNKSVAVTMHVTSQPILPPPSQITFTVVQGAGATTANTFFPNIGLGKLAITGVTSSGGSWLSALVVDGSTVAVSASPGSLAPGSYTGTLILISNAANTSTPIPVRMNVVAQSNPLVTVGGVVDNAAFTPGQPVGAGTIAAVFGSQFSTSGPAYAANLPLPTTLANVQVLINGTAVPLFYVDGTQADIQVPFGLTGPVTVQLSRNGQLGNAVSASVDSIAPRLFPLRQLPAAPDTSPYGLVINASDGTLALPSTLGVPAHPAKRGDVITIYALGLGPVSPAVNTGAGAPAAEPLARTSNSVQVMFGGGFIPSVGATPSYAGLAPTYAGLYQINVAIPAASPTGNVPMMLSMPGHVSNFVILAINP